MSEQYEIHRELNKENLDSILQELTSRKDIWTTLPLEEKIELLVSLRKSLKEHAEEWVEATARGKKLAKDSVYIGEEWTFGPYSLAGGINALIDTLTSLKNGQTKLPGKIRVRDDGQVIAKVYPQNMYDTLIMNGVSAEVWMEPGVTKDDLVTHTAKLYKEEGVKGAVTLVLGAGNVSSICAFDVLYMLFAKGSVVVCKLNVVNDCMFPALQKIFSPFIAAGYVRFVCGEVDVGKYLTDHDLVDAIHLTGSSRTHDAIVFGVGEEGTKRKAANNPRLDKEITSELGGVGAVIVVPGPWTNADIAFQAEHIATMKLHNTGCNCIAAQVVVMPRTWRQSKSLVGKIRDLFATIPERPLFYPGAEDRLNEAISKGENAEVIKGRAFVGNVDAKGVDEYAFRTEFFTTALSQTYLEGDDAKTYLENAIKFVNESAYGTLGVTLLIHPKTIKVLGSEFGDCLAKLRYGAIGVNIWCGLVYFIPHCAWGAFPGHTLDDIQSGKDFVHNAYLFDKPQKSIIYGPFWEAPRSLLHGSLTLFPKPPWFVTNKTSGNTLKALTYFALEPRVTKLPNIVASAFRG